MQFHVGSQQDCKLEVSHNSRYSPSHAGSHEKGKKASISPPCSRCTLRCIQLQDPTDQSQQLGNHITADQLLLSMRTSVEDRQRCLLHRWTKGRCHSRAEATKQFSCSDHEIWHFQAFFGTTRVPDPTQIIWIGKFPDLIVFYTISYFTKVRSWVSRSVIWLIKACT